MRVKKHDAETGLITGVVIDTVPWFNNKVILEEERDVWSPVGVRLYRKDTEKSHTCHVRDLYGKGVICGKFISSVPYSILRDK